MPKAARLGDSASGHGCFPPTQITSGSGDVLINGLPAARVGDSAAPHGCKDCPPHGRTLVAGSASVFINGKPAVRVGDALSCGGVVISGSPNVFIGDQAVYSVDQQDNYQLLDNIEISTLSDEEWAQLPTDTQEHFADLRQADPQQTEQQHTPPSTAQPDTRQSSSATATPAAQSTSATEQESEPVTEPEPFVAGFLWNKQLSTMDQLYKDHYGSFDSKKLSYFKQVNSHLQSQQVLPGELVIFANPPITQADSEALTALQQQARLASQGIQRLTPAEAHTVMQHFSLLDAVNSDHLANGSVAVGVTSAMAYKRLTDLQKVLEKLNQNYMNNVQVVNGKAHFGHGFYIQRATLFRELDNSLSRLTLMSLDLPVSQKVKHTLELSSKSLLHNWDQILAKGSVPQLGQRINIVARAAKGAERAGYIGITLDAGVAVNEIGKACFGPETEQCEKVTYSEVGRLGGSVGGGIMGARVGSAVTTVAAGFVIAAGVTIYTPVLAIIALGGAGVGAYYGSSSGGEFGEFFGEKTYEYMK
ncbi:MAG: PAAR domain-containing protein [Amphritea sp.]